jgi:hypothetical protein
MFTHGMTDVTRKHTGFEDALSCLSYFKIEESVLLQSSITISIECPSLVSVQAPVCVKVGNEKNVMQSHTHDRGNVRVNDLSGKLYFVSKRSEFPFTQILIQSSIGSTWQSSLAYHIVGFFDSNRLTSTVSFVHSPKISAYAKTLVSLTEQ